MTEENNTNKQTGMAAETPINRIAKEPCGSGPVNKVEITMPHVGRRFDRFNRHPHRANNMRVIRRAVNMASNFNGRAAHGLTLDVEDERSLLEIKERWLIKKLEKVQARITELKTA